MRPLELLLRSSAWLSLVGWTVANWLESRPRAARCASSLGVLMLAVHTALAFEIRYAWSHALAARETARQTEVLFGWSSGAEVFVNYLFLLVWTADVAWWWLSIETYRQRPPALTRAVRGFFLLMFASGAVVFVRGPLRLLGAAAILAAAWAWYRGARARTATPNV
jgi:hypothetical protein